MNVGGGWCRGQTPRTARKLAGAFTSLSIACFKSKYNCEYDWMVQDVMVCPSSQLIRNRARCRKGDHWVDCYRDSCCPGYTLIGHVNLKYFCVFMVKYFQLVGVFLTPRIPVVTSMVFVNNSAPLTLAGSSVPASVVTTLTRQGQPHAIRHIL